MNRITRPRLVVATWLIAVALIGSACAGSGRSPDIKGPTSPHPATAATEPNAEQSAPVTTVAPATGVDPTAPAQPAPPQSGPTTATSELVIDIDMTELDVLLGELDTVFGELDDAVSQTEGDTTP